MVQEVGSVVAAVLSPRRAKKNDAFARLVLRTRRRTERNECSDRLLLVQALNNEDLLKRRTRQALSTSLRNVSRPRCSTTSSVGTSCGAALTTFNAQLKGVFLASPTKIAMEDTAAYVIKCKSLTYSSFVEDSQHSAIANSIKAAIFAFEIEGDRVERRRQVQVVPQGEGEGGGQEEESRHLHLGGQGRRRRSQPQEVRRTMHHVPS